MAKSKSRSFDSLRSLRMTSCLGRGSWIPTLGAKTKTRREPAPEPAEGGGTPGKHIKRGVVMMRKLLQAILCIILCPLLAARQVASSGQGPVGPESHPAAQSKGATINLRRGNTVSLIRLETISSATAQVGQRVRFAVSEDVKVDGVIVIPKGTSASTVVTYVRKAIGGKRNGIVEDGPPSLILPDGSSIQLRNIIPPDSDAPGPIVILFVVLLIGSLPYLFSNMFKAKHPAPKRGNDEILPQCGQSWEVATTKKVRINLAILNKIQLSPPTVDIDSICPARAR